MKIKLLKDDLLGGIQRVQNIVSTKTTLPILSNMLLETNAGNVKLNTTDLDIGISCEIPVNTLEEGAITIPAKRFSDIIRELPPGDIVISVKKNNQVDIEGEKCRFKLIGMPKEEFPKFPEFKDKEVVRIKQSVFKEMLSLTAFAVSHEESRYVLNGILIRISGNDIHLVATDGRRLAKSDKKLETTVKKDIAVIIPAKAVQEILRNLGDDGDIAMVTGTNQVLFDINGVLIATRIIEGDFPDYNNPKVIPKPILPRIKIDTQDFLSAIRRANLLSTPDFQAIKFEVFTNKIVISKITPDVGESREEVAIEYGGKEMIVGFNPQYLIDALKNIHAKTIDLELLGPDKAGVVRLDDYLYLVLPMRL